MTATATPKAKSVDIHNIGAIKDLTFDMPDGTGGVLVLKGANKKGKSTAIRVLRAILSGSGRLDPRDGAVRGVAEAFGQRVSVTSQTRFTGDCQVESLEGKFDFSDLVHPEAKEPETRDKIRIKALLSLTGAAADVSIFYDLVGGKEQFEKLIPAESIKKKDLVELAGMVHRALHAEAKKKESEADYALGHAKACKEAAGCEEIVGSIDLVPLHDASTAASGAVEGIRQRLLHADENRKRAETVKRAIDEATENYNGPSLQVAEGSLKLSGEQLNEAENAVGRLKAELAKAEAAAQMKELTFRECAARKRQAENHEQGLVSMNSMLNDAEQALGDAPKPGEMEAAVAKADKARDDLEIGIHLRDASMKLIEADAHAKTAEEAKAQAERLRESARSVDQVLSHKLPVGPLRAEGGRLVCDTERGESAPFDSCSDGEKWSIALPYGIEAVGEQGVLAVAQDSWQDCDHNARSMIAAKCQAAKVWIITGEVAKGDLRAEVYQPEA